MDASKTEQKDEARALLREVAAIWLPREVYTRDIRQRILRYLLETPPARVSTNPYPNQPWRNWVRLGEAEER